MAVIKCKMCGGDMDISQGVSVCECEYCGTRQTVPSADNDKKLTLFSRANRLRLANEFDKAAGIYEQILAEDPDDAEAYWSRVLCRYGIEYVEDPTSRRRIPTVNRAQYTSIFDDEDYKAAVATRDHKLLALVNAGYDTMHITMSYDGNQSKAVCDEGIRLANEIIKICSKMMPKQQ